MTVYLIHFDTAVGNPASPRGMARHYIGSTGDIAARLAEHHAGNGSKLMAAVSAAGIGWELVRTWPGGRTVERALKQRKAAPRLCPTCNPGNKRARGAPGLPGGNFELPAFELPEINHGIIAFKGVLPF